MDGSGESVGLMAFNLAATAQLNAGDILTVPDPVVMNIVVEVGVYAGKLNDAAWSGCSKLSSSESNYTKGVTGTDTINCGCEGDDEV